MCGGGGHAWLLGGICGCGGGHVVAGEGGMCGCGGCAWLGACVVAGEHAGGMCGYWGACVVVGGVRGGRGECVVAGGVAWLWGGMRGCWGGCVGYDEILSMSGRYASYWNAFLFQNWFDSFCFDLIYANFSTSLLH